MQYDLKYFADICPDKNVPVIAVFTKHDQFKRNIKMKLMHEGRDPETELDTEVESVFNQYYLVRLSGPPPFVCLERMHKPDQRCTDLIEMTANTLSGGVVALMLMAVQRDNLELSIKLAIKGTYRLLGKGPTSTEIIIKICIMAFPSIWLLYMSSSNVGNEDPLEELLQTLEKFFNQQSEFELQRFLGDFTLGQFESVFHKLSSFYSNPDLFISSDESIHTMIATVLIMEYASILFTSPSRPTCEEAMDGACSRFRSSGTHNVVNRLFLPSPKPYSTQQCEEFILMHRLR